MQRIAHIFRKDTRHLWPMLVVVCVLVVFHAQAVLTEAGTNVAASVSLGGLYYGLAGLSVILWPLSIILLVVALVHDESLVGTEQFWLTRPYSRTQLLLEKLLFVTVWVLLPMLLHDLFLIHHYGYAISSAISLLLWKQAELAALLLVILALATVTSNFARFFLWAIVVLIATAFAVFDLIPKRMETFHLPGLAGDADLLAAAGVVVLGAITIVVWQYFQRSTVVAVAGGVLFLAAGLLLIRFWPTATMRDFFTGNGPEELRSFQFKPDGNLRDLGMSAVSSDNENFNEYFRTLLYPFEATGLPDDIAVLGVGFAGSLDAAEHKTVHLSSGMGARFQPQAGKEDGRFVQVGGSTKQLVPLATINRKTFDSIKDSNATLSGTAYFEALRTQHVRVPVRSPRGFNEFQIGGKTCRVWAFPYNGILTAQLLCTELEPGRASDFSVRLSRGADWILPKVPGQNSAGELPSLLSPILQTSYTFEFYPSGKPDGMQPASAAGQQFLVIAEEPVATFRRSFRIDNFRAPDYDSPAWKQRGLLASEPEPVQASQ